MRTTFADWKLSTAFTAFAGAIRHQKARSKREIKKGHADHTARAPLVVFYRLTGLEAVRRAEQELTAKELRRTALFWHTKEGGHRLVG